MRSVLFGMTSGSSVRPFMAGQGRHLAQQGWDVHLLCSPEADIASLAEDEGMTFHPTNVVRNPSPLNDLVSLFLFVREVHRINPTIAVWGTPKASLLGTFSTRVLGIPSLYIIHGFRYEGSTGWRREVLKMFERATCSMATRVASVGQELRQLAIRDRIVPASKVTVMANGSANGVDGQAHPAHYREELGIPADATLCSFVGRITVDKGIRELVSAWKTVHETCPNAHLIVCGSPDESDLVSEELRSSVAALPNTHMLGHISDVDAIWPDVDIELLPSYREGLPLVLIEAAAAGVPIVTSNATGCAEVVADGETGFVVPKKDAPRFAQAIISLIQDPARRKQMGDAARRRVLQRYDRLQLWKAIDAELTDLAQRSGR